MASKANIIDSTNLTPPETTVEGIERGLLRSTRDQEIRNRACQIYLQRGGQLGYDVQDWLQVERELRHLSASRGRPWL